MRRPDTRVSRATTQMNERNVTRKTPARQPRSRAG